MDDVKGKTLRSSSRWRSSRWKQMARTTDGYYSRRIKPRVFTTRLSCARFKDLINPLGVLVGFSFSAEATHELRHGALRSWEWTLLHARLSTGHWHWPVRNILKQVWPQSVKPIDNNETIIKTENDEHKSENENFIHGARPTTFKFLQ